jgi:hypothetical protein
LAAEAVHNDFLSDIAQNCAGACLIKTGGQNLENDKLRGEAPSTVRLAVTETLVQEVAKSASGVHVR